MIFVAAESTARARSWCRENGVQPTARTTRILTPQSPHGGRGRMLTADDRVVILDEAVDPLARAVLVPAGLGTVIQPEYVA